MENTHAQAKNPHMMAVATACVASGVLQIAAGTGQQQVNDISPGAVAMLWSVLAIGGGGSVIVGAYLKDVVLGLEVERVGHFALVVSFVTYLVSLVEAMSTPWWTSTAFWVAGLLMVASVMRAFLITRVMWRARRKARRKSGGTW